MRRLAGLALLVGGPLLLRRHRGARRERVELFFADGSAVTLDRGPDAEALLAAARGAV